MSGNKKRLRWRNLNFLPLENAIHIELTSLLIANSYKSIYKLEWVSLVVRKIRRVVEGNRKIHP